jgi:hypothetical protein
MDLLTQIFGISMGPKDIKNRMNPIEVLANLHLRDQDSNYTYKIKNFMEDNEEI